MIMDDTEIDSSEDFSLDTVFPEAPRPPSPEPTISTYVRGERSDRIEQGSGRSDADGNEDGWTEIRVRLVGSHPLWGHYLWNAARSFATYLDHNARMYRGKNVLELGAGGGLPGLVTILNGARRTVLTDYPDKTLIDNLEYNVKQNIPAPLTSNVFVEGYIWGAPVDRLLEAAPEKFDLIILSDLIFNHSQHEALLRSCELTLRENNNNSTDTQSETDNLPTVLVFYTHHRPHLATRDLEFFTKARERGWMCKEVVTERYSPMFLDDPGDEEVRATVHGWALTR